MDSHTTFECMIKLDSRILSMIRGRSSPVPAHQLVVQNNVPYPKHSVLNTHTVPSL